MERKKYKRIILAGGPSCGKTTLTKELERRGYNVVHEAAREVINEGRFKPGTAEFQVEIFRRQVERENNYCPPAFFDRSALEGIAYSRLFNSSIPSVIKDFDYSKRYSLVFILERLPFVADGVRVEKNDEEAERVHREIALAYRERGYEPIFVPAFLGELSHALAKRADFILSRVGGIIDNGN